jgi:hypothetical protein
MKATLTYCNHLREPVVSFEVGSPVTVVGRGSPEVLRLPEVVKKVSRQDPFGARLGDTLFIAIPSDIRLARSHFSIRRAAGESGEAVFLIRDLQSHCGFMVNDVLNAGSAELQLKGGDRIHYGFEFVFNVVAGESDDQDSRAEPGAPD